MKNNKFIGNDIIKVKIKENYFDIEENTFFFQENRINLFPSIVTFYNNQVVSVEEAI